ncbi:MAG TPA: hypothetical protein VJ933_09960, partial [Phaeodactylibacter sp.]|nr:hypothetical protein [Phaeodactylibacter sp.]
MRLYSTKSRGHYTDLKEAVLRGLPPDNGLYMPEQIPALPSGVLDSLHDMPFSEIAFAVSRSLLQGAIPEP